jgi:hypothetical protein
MEDTKSSFPIGTTSTLTSDVILKNYKPALAHLDEVEQIQY